MQAQGGRVSVDLSSASGIAESGREKLLVAARLLGPELVFANEGELAAIGGEVPGDARAQARARSGFSVGGAELRAPRRPSVVDTTGAGDALAAGFLLGGAGAGRSGRGGALRRAARGDAVSAPVVSDEVADALARRRAGRRLETTLVAHGFPPGEGFAVGLASERRVRDGGRRAGDGRHPRRRARRRPDEAELERFDARRRARSGPRDLAACCVQGALGATTVGGTLAACRAAGIGFMAPAGSAACTAGSRIRPTSRPTSASSRAPQALVVSSGVKSLLDVPATSELLETLGIPVLGYRTDTLPLFYAAPAGRRVSARVETRREAAARRARALGPRRRRRSCSPGRPPESLDDVEPLIEEALAEATRAGRARAGDHAVRARAACTSAAAAARSRANRELDRATRGSPARSRSPIEPPSPSSRH